MRRFGTFAGIVAGTFLAGEGDGFLLGGARFGISARVIVLRHLEDCLLRRTVVNGAYVEPDRRPFVTFAVWQPWQMPGRNAAICVATVPCI